LQTNRKDAFGLECSNTSVVYLVVLMNKIIQINATSLKFFPKGEISLEEFFK